MNNISEDLNSLIDKALDKKWVEISLSNVIAGYISQNWAIHPEGVTPEQIFACADEIDTEFHNRFIRIGKNCLKAAHDSGDCLHYSKESYNQFCHMLLSDLELTVNAEVRLLCDGIMLQCLTEYRFAEPYGPWLDSFLENIYQLLVGELSDMAHRIIEERAKFKE